MSRKNVLFINNGCTHPASLEVLRREGHDIYLTDDVDAGLRQLDGIRYDVIILQQSPQTEIWQLCRDIKNITDTPLIVISNRASARDCVKAINAGADYFLRKPFGPLEFSARIRSLLQRNIPARQAIAIG